MKKYSVTKTGRWWVSEALGLWKPYEPTPEEVARAGDQVGVLTFVDSDEEYVRLCCKELGASIVEDTVVLPKGFQASGPLSGTWSEVAQTFRDGIIQFRIWRLEGFV